MKQVTITRDKGQKPITGNVGIGEPAPAEKLQVTIADSGTTWADYDGIRIYNSDTTINAGGRLFFNLGSTGTAQAGIAGVRVASSDSALAFITEDSDTITEKMRITETGNVGIGTTSPGFNLQVAGSSNTLASFNRTAQGNAEVQISSTDNVRGAFLLLASPGSNTWSIGNVGTQGLGPAGSLAVNNGVLRFMITPDGNVGINESSPSETLTVNGTMNIRPAGTSALYVSRAGNVGIGTTSPGAMLDVNGNVTMKNVQQGSNVKRIYIASMTGLPDNTKTLLLNMSVGTQGILGGTIHYMIGVDPGNGGTSATETGEVVFAANHANDGGTFVSTIAKKDSATLTEAGRTDTVTWAIDSETTSDTVGISVTADDSANTYSNIVAVIDLFYTTKAAPAIRYILQ